MTYDEMMMMEDRATRRLDVVQKLQAEPTSEKSVHSHFNQIRVLRQRRRDRLVAFFDRAAWTANVVAAT